MYLTSTFKWAAEVGEKTRQTVQVSKNISWHDPEKEGLDKVA